MNRQIPLYTALLLAVASVCLTVVVTSFIFAGRFGMVARKAFAVERLLDKVYVDEVDKVKASDAAAAAVIASTGDPWSYYIPAADYDAYLESTSNSYTGIGVVLEMREGDSSLYISSVTDGSPADVSGILPGDILLSLDGVSLSGLMPADVRNMIMNTNGSDFEFSIDRNGEILAVRVFCGTVAKDVAVYGFLEEGIGYIRILNFEANCCRQTLDCISALLQDGAQGIVFDVRSNPGGKRTELVEVLDYILPEGVLFRSIDYNGEEMISQSDENCLDLPMVVLVNKNSYSAAEFFAAALQEYGWADVVGEKTVGKGNYQIVYTLSDGSACGISSGRYYTPHGNSLEGVGVTPNVEVTMDYGAIASVRDGVVFVGDDLQLSAAVDNLRQNLLQK